MVGVQEWMSRGSGGPGSGYVGSGRGPGGGCVGGGGGPVGRWVVGV